jgi:hypothetical protein
VEARLRELGVGDERPMPEWETLPATTSFDAIATAVREDLCESCDTLESEARVVPSAPAGLEAALLRVHGPEFRCGEYASHVLAVRVANDLVVGGLGAGCVEDMHGYETPNRAEARYEDVLPGGRPELVVEVEVGGSDGPADWSTHDWRDVRVVVCTLDRGPLACAWLAPTDAGMEYESEELEENGEPTMLGYASTLRFALGRAVFERDATYPGSPPADIALQTLFEHGDHAWPATYEWR